MRRIHTHNVSVLAFACILASGLLTGTTHAGTQPTTATGWAVCAPFEKAANAQKKISRNAYQKIVSGFMQFTKKPVSIERAAGIYLSATTVNMIDMKPWQWKGIKESIEGIYAKKMLAHLIEVDVNNDGSLESIIAFVPPSSSSPFSYVLDEHGRLNQHFLGSDGRPINIDGTFVVYNNKTYLLTEWGTRAYDDGRPSEQVVDVYRPQKNPMRAKGGIAEHGAGQLCEFKIIN